MDLKNKAINIKGKKYVLVSDRVIYFNEAYPNGSIETTILSELDSELIYIKATVTPDVSQNRKFIGHSQAKWGDGYINRTSALENAETSAVGRALAMMGIGVIDSIASVDEINKAEITENQNIQISKKDADLVQQVLEITKDKFTLSVADHLKRTGYLSAKQREKMEDIITDSVLYNQELNDNNGDFKRAGLDDYEV